MAKPSKPIPEDVPLMLGYDETSPSKLRWIVQIPRSKHRAGSTAGYLDMKGRYCVKIRGSLYKAHRVIWYLHYGEIPDGFEIDHKDNDPSNNLIGNLRLARMNENSWNRSKSALKKADLPKGVSFARPRGTEEGYMVATVKKNGTRYTKGGYILTELVAWLDNKRVELHEEFSNNG